MIFTHRICIFEHNQSLLSKNIIYADNLHEDKWKKTIVKAHKFPKLKSFVYITFFRLEWSESWENIDEVVNIVL